MITIDTVLAQLTDSDVLYEALLKTLRETAPDFPDEERKFSDAAASLRTSLTTEQIHNLDTYLDAAQAEVAAITVYTGWLGFQLNLNCWTNPVNKLMLTQDYEEITQERTFEAIPGISQARRKAEASFTALWDADEALLSNIGSYFAYLHTVAPKLAHLFGFRLANHFFSHVIPGYQPDTLLTEQYEHELKEYLALSSLC